MFKCIKYHHDPSDTNQAGSVEKECDGSFSLCRLGGHQGTWGRAGLHASIAAAAPSCGLSKLRNVPLVTILGGAEVQMGQQNISFVVTSSSKEISRAWGMSTHGCNKSPVSKVNLGRVF